MPSSSKMWAGLMSRWTKPIVWAAAWTGVRLPADPDSTSATIGGPVASSFCCKVGPATYSMTR